MNNRNQSFIDKIVIFLFITAIILFFIKVLCPQFFEEHNPIQKTEFKNVGEWIVAEDEMINPRSMATANLLPGGNVLIMGGSNRGASDYAEIFDPKQMKIIKRIPLNDYRAYGYSAVSLLNGNVFIAGGEIYKPKTYPKPTNTTKIFDAETYTFKETEPMKYNHSFQFSNAFLLKNGNVFLPVSSKGIIYNPSKNIFYETKNEAHKDDIGSKLMLLENGDIIFTCTGRLTKKEYKGKGSMCLYKHTDNEFEPYEYMPKNLLFIQLDNENYLSITPELTCSSGYIYNIKRNEKIPVNNRINRTWIPGQIPVTVLLKNGNVLIIGISLVNNSQKYIHSIENRKTKKYSAYIYDRKTNKFYEVQAPPIPFDSPGITTLENGDILFAGGRSDEKGNKIQIYKYKH